MQARGKATSRRPSRPCVRPYFDQIWSWGGDPFPDNGKKCGYDSTQSLAAFNSIVDLYNSGVPTPSQFADQGAEHLFLTGRVGM